MHDDIAYAFVEHLFSAYLLERERGRRLQSTCGDKYGHRGCFCDRLRVRTAERTLLCLRLTTTVFQRAIDRLLFGKIAISEFSTATHRWLGTPLTSKSIAQSVQVYSLRPNLCVEPPIVKRSPTDYYPDLYCRSRARKPRYRDMKAEHEMRIRFARRYDEQTLIIWPTCASISRYARWALQAQPAAQTPRGQWTLQMLIRWILGALGYSIIETNYFKALDIFVDLRCSEIFYPNGSHAEQMMAHRAQVVRQDMKTALCRYLARRPPALSELRLKQITLTDLELFMKTLVSLDIQFSAPQNARLPNVRKMELTFVADPLFPPNKENPYSQWVHRHPSGGAPINALLASVMSLTDLQIQFQGFRKYRDEVLVLQDLKVPALRKLKKTTLTRLAISAEALCQLVDGSEFCKVITNKYLLLLPGRLTWFDIIMACKLQNNHFSTLGYLDETRRHAFVSADKRDKQIGWDAVKFCHYVKAQYKKDVESYS